MLKVHPLLFVASKNPILHKYEDSLFHKDKEISSDFGLFVVPIRIF